METLTHETTTMTLSNTHWAAIVDALYELRENHAENDTHWKHLTGLIVLIETRCLEPELFQEATA